MRRNRQHFSYVPAKVWIRNFIRSHTFFLPLIGLVLGMLLWCFLGDNIRIFIAVLVVLLLAIGFYGLAVNGRKSPKPNYLFLAKLRFWRLAILNLLLGSWLLPPQLPQIPIQFYKKNQVDVVVVDPLNRLVEIEGRYVCKCSWDSGLLKNGLYLGMHWVVSSKCVKSYQFSGIPDDVNWPRVMGSMGYSGVVRISSKYGFKMLVDKDIGWLDRAKFSMLFWCKQRLFQQFEYSKAGLLWAMLFGDKTYVDQQYIEQFNTGGLMHALAVSGMHISLILGVLFWVFSGFGKWASPGKGSLFFIVILGWFYALMAGSGAAIIRAILSASWLWLGRYFFYRKVSPLHVWFGTAYIQLVFSPYLIFQAGFQLSYLAVLGLLVLYPLLKSIWASGQNKVLNYLGDTLAMNIAATLFTLPLILGLFHRFPSWFLLGNVVLLPLLSGLVYLTVLCMLFEEIEWVGEFLVWVTQKTLWLMDGVLWELEQLPLPFLLGYDWDEFSLMFLFLWLVIFCLWIWTRLDTTRRWPWRLKHGHGFAFTVFGLLAVLLFVEVAARSRAKSVLTFQAQVSGWEVAGRKIHDTLFVNTVPGDGLRLLQFNRRSAALGRKLEKVNALILDKSEVFRRRYGVKVVVFSNVL